MHSLGKRFLLAHPNTIFGRKINKQKKKSAGKMKAEVPGKGWKQAHTKK